MKQDFRFAFRMIALHRWFSAAIIATLALGIGLNTMVFTIVDAVLFKPVPVPGGERLVSVLTRDLRANRRDQQRLPTSWPDFIYYRSHVRSLSALEAGSETGAILSEKDIAPDHYNMFRISPGFFGMLHIRPVRGRDFAPSDAKFGAPAVALLGYSIWKNRYGGRDVLGRTVRINSVPTTIVGVIPEGLRFPSNQDLWTPLQAGADLEDRSKRPLLLFGMLKPGVTFAQAAAEFGVMSQRLAEEFPKDDKDMAALVQTFHQRYSGDEIQTVFLLMMAAVSLVLLIACANVANMLLGRALARGREISIRVAIGASRWQIVRQLLIESLALSVLGGLAGLSLSAFGVHWFDLQVQDVGKPYWIQFAMDYRVFFYFAIVCVSSALLFGLAPALRSSGSDVNSALKEGVRSSGTRRSGRLSTLLVVFQFGLALLLLFGAGVFMRSFVEKQSMNPWMSAAHLLTARVNLPDERYKDAVSHRRFFDQLLPRLKAIPGVQTAALTSDLPGSGSGTRRIEIEGTPVADQEHAPSAAVVAVTPGYFKAMNLPLLRGRDFNAVDGSPGQARAIVTKDFASRFWPEKDPIGRRFRFYEKNKPGGWVSVIGISGDIVQFLEPLSDPVLFMPYQQDSSDSMALLVRTDRPSSIVSAVRAAVQSLDQDLPLFEASTMSEFTEHQIWFLRVFGTVFFVFAAIALLLASVGIYAVMAQATGSRTREIGVRMALGATPAKILALILGRGLWQLLAGLFFGAAFAIPAARVMSSLRFLDAPSDPRMIAGVCIVLWTIGLLACWLPARRAAALNPVSAIRDE